MNKTSIIPIVFATNENYAPCAGVAIRSLIENADAKMKYEVYVFFTQLSNYTIFRLENLSTENVKIKAVDVNLYIKELYTLLYQMEYYTVEMYYRMLIPTVLPMFDKVIYLDSDVVILDDVKKLYNFTEFKNNELLAGCVDMGLNDGGKKYIKTLGISDAEKYINSGVLVLNAKLLRDEKTFEKIKDVLSKFPKLRFPDQDIINMVCCNRICYFDNYWNFQWASTFGKSVERMINEKHGIIHYTSNMKPWKNPTMPLSDCFWKFARYTPFYEQILYKMGE